MPGLTPDEVDKSISGDTAKLYRMIWSRFMASQMADCQQDTVSVTVYAGDYRFKASGYTVTFDGFTVLYEEATDEKEKKETSLPTDTITRKEIDLRGARTSAGEFPEALELIATKKVDMLKLLTKTVKL